ncbi:MAG: 16S rRNA (uracil(1498)-N(3))-methyltransferase [bacterium]|nr:16S rRNA (uracil(1498)-N(3))-methyltransferase [bacterium]
MARCWRVLVERLGSEPGERIALPREEAHHVARVLRLREGESLSLFDGRGLERRATVVAIAGAAVEVETGEKIETSVEAPLDVHLFQGRCRHDRVEWLLQKGTEVGLSAVNLFRCERAEGGVPSAGRLGRWNRILAEACKQSGRRVLPELEADAELPLELPDGVLALLLDTGPEVPPLADALERMPPPDAVWLAVGPEGGFSAEEAAAARDAGWCSVSLGPRVLRTETAGLTAAALVLHRWGDLGRLAG